MTDEKFSWSNADVVIRTQPAIAVYLNPHDEVVIRQQCDYDEDQWVFITKENLPKLIQALLEAGGMTATAPQSMPTSPSKDRTAAERQRKRRAKQRDTVTPTVTHRDAQPDLLRSLREKVGADNA